MTSGEVKAQCWFCQHFDVTSGWTKTPTCTAFPDGIPTEIYANIFDHREKYENDNDIQFLQHPLDDMSKRGFSLLLINKKKT
ncbi:MAG: hypothetical protein AAF126_11420, partial [Chloroflexota bacterium]